MSNLYAIERNGEYVRHVVVRRSKTDVYGTASIETLIFDTKEKAKEVSRALKGRTKVVEYIEELRKAA